ncbi:hypothetical protein D9613_000534 [Agrocybe pediades]|uniref:N-alpha-acetyltransferase 60 n=1 Tax=Agrocybe pediades TaxID=84607 RepID=A0A8H4R109_9AGAR|nr:hypothetical protein D9613_000534 [Agrocybe pediades]
MSVSPFLDDVVLKSLTARDLKRVQDLHSLILPVRYPTSFFLQLLVIPNRTCFVAYSQGHPVGFISAAIQKPIKCFTFSPPDNHPLVVPPEFQDSPAVLSSSQPIEILTLGVLPACQKCGLARRLVHFLVESVRKESSCATNSFGGTLIYANVAASNTQALEFYERIGMVVFSDVIRNLYRTLSSGSRDAYLVAGVL